MKCPSCSQLVPPSTRNTVTFWDKAESFPPILVRLLAIWKRRPITDHEIAQHGGLAPHQVYVISWHTDWSGIDLITMQRFLTGCRLDICNHPQIKRACVYLAEQERLRRQGRLGWQYLRQSPLWETFYKPLTLTWLKSLKTE